MASNRDVATDERQATRMLQFELWSQQRELLLQQILRGSISALAMQTEHHGVTSWDALLF